MEKDWCPFCKVEHFFPHEEEITRGDLTKCFAFYDWCRCGCVWEAEVTFYPQDGGIGEGSLL